jgi:hypothetical protein
MCICSYKGTSSGEMVISEDVLSMVESIVTDIMKMEEERYEILESASRALVDGAVTPKISAFILKQKTLDTVLQMKAVLNGWKAVNAVQATVHMYIHTQNFIHTYIHTYMHIFYVYIKILMYF